MKEFKNEIIKKDIFLIINFDSHWKNLKYKNILSDFDSN
jgi:hypothetical protein